MYTLYTCIGYMDHEEGIRALIYTRNNSVKALAQNTPTPSGRGA